MRLTSPAFSPASRLPRVFSLDGANRSPPLEWSGVPAKAQSLVLLCDDPDAPSGTWRHWAVYDLPPDLDGLPEGYSRSGMAPAAREAVNDFKRSGYDGPAPPHGHGTHHYHFRLLALDIAKLPTGAAPTCADVESAARPHVLAAAELIGTYAR